MRVSPLLAAALARACGQVAPAWAKAAERTVAIPQVRTGASSLTIIRTGRSHETDRVALV
jgi:hypothetical protein